MFPKPKPSLQPNTYAYESEPMVKVTGFREYDARWLFGKEINLMGIQALGMGLGALISELGVKQEVVTAGYSNGTILMVRLTDGAEILVRRNGEAPVTALAWNAKGTLLAFAAEDGDGGLLEL